MKQVAAAGLGAATVLGVHVRWIRPRVFNWGATGDEVSRLMADDELCPRPQLDATRAVTIAARPEDIWPWLVQWGWNRVGFYSHELPGNLGRPSAQQILPQFQHLAVGDWVPMGGKTTPYTAWRVARQADALAEGRRHLALAAQAGRPAAYAAHHAATMP